MTESTHDLTGTREFMRLLEIEFDQRSPTYVSGSIAADERHHQPWGLVHGGLYTTAIETFATTGAFEAVKGRGQQAVGVSNSTDFLRPHRAGRLNVSAVGPRTRSSWHGARFVCRTSRRASERSVLHAWSERSAVA
jgi:uncharacterized protein (TIGR00369 family)